MINQGGYIILIFGPSGAGKSTLMNLLKNENNFYIPICSTTRQARQDEVNGQDYKFLSIDEFYQNNYKYIYSCHGNIYGIPYEIVDNYKSGKKIVMGVSRKLIGQIKRDFQNVLVIFINIHIDLIKYRLVARDPKIQDKDLETREKKSIELIEWSKISNDIDYFIDNSSDISELRDKFFNSIKECDC